MAKMEKILVYLSLGGNEGDVLVCLKKVLYLLSQHADISQLRVSHFYRTSPLHVDSSNWFINAVCSFHTDLSPRELFSLTQSIEIQLGKVFKPKTASRPIDIDLLFYSYYIYQDEDLKIPHPSWKERLFVLIPLADLTQNICLQTEVGMEEHILQDLIQVLIHQSSQAVSLLEKNLHFK